MDTSTVTQKGQVTIPIGMRRSLRLRTGDRVAFAQEAGGVVIKPVEQKVSSAFGLVKARRSASLADMERAIRKRAGR